MSFIQSVLTALFCMVFVFAVLFALWGMIWLFSLIVRKIENSTHSVNTSER
jgi:Na+-transporting methylmalonyl-CoA/oxaloacetate decarboxylase gamma subunit